jgi:hypothetical protein
VALGGLSVLFVGLVLLDPDAREFCIAYVNVQVIASVSGMRDVSGSRLGRFFIVAEIAESLAPILASALALIWMSRRWQTAPGLTAAFHLTAMRGASFCFVTALSASLPIVLSPKQLGHYALPSYPYYALALSFCCAPALMKLWANCPRFTRPHLLLRRCAASAAVAVVGLCVVHRGEPLRDRELFHDNLVLGNILPRNAVIGGSYDLGWDSSIRSYLHRWHRVSVALEDRRCQYWLQSADLANPPEGFVVVEAGLLRYRLYRRVGDAGGLARATRTASPDAVR